MKIKVCCPSYKRPKNILTLKKYPFINLYVDIDEAEEYKKNNPNANICEIPKGIQGNIGRVY